MVLSLCLPHLKPLRPRALTTILSNRLFQGTSVFLENTCKQKVEIGVANDDAISQARRSIKFNKSVVIPDKDKHHYSTVLAKVLNLRTFCVFRKIIYQFLFRNILNLAIQPTRHSTFENVNSS